MPKTKDPDRAIAKSSKPSSDTGIDKGPTAVFVGMALDMSWKLAIVVLVPIIGGFKLDEALDKSPLLTITGFLVAMTGMGIVMRQTYSAANQIDLPKNLKKENK